MKYENMFVGSRLMETITSGLYDGNLNCLREYVQNSIDSHAKKIEISFENGTSNLVIRDNGSGMDREALIHSLGIGVSNKSEEDIGWRGVGIWSGVPVCRRIVIITKKKENSKYRIEINNDLIRNESLSNKSILEILSNATGEIEDLSLGNNESYEDDHFTIIRLESILPTQKYLFKNKLIVEYLSSELPVPLNSKVFPYAGDIEGWLNEQGVQYPYVEILFNNSKIYRPPTKSDIFLKCLVKKEFIIKNELIAVGWFLAGLENEKLKMPNCGIYFKKKGFTIGDTNLVLRQFSGMYHPWQYGEVHIISPKIRENAARNNFEYNSGNVDLFLEEVGNFIKYLEQLNRYKSQRTSHKSILKIKSNFEQKNLASCLKDIKEIRRRFNYPVSFPKESSLLPMKRAIDEESNREVGELDAIEQFIIEDNKGELQREKEKKIILKDMDIVNNAKGSKIQNIVRDAEIKNISNERDSLNVEQERETKDLLDKANSKLDKNLSNKLGKEMGQIKISEMNNKNFNILSDFILGRSYDYLDPRIKEIFAKNIENTNVFVDTDLDSIREIFLEKLNLDSNLLALYNILKNEDKDSFELLEKASPEERKFISLEMILAVDLIYRLLKNFNY